MPVTSPVGHPHEAVTPLIAGVARTPVGAAGTTVTVPGAEVGPVPIALVAATRTWYVVPAVRPLSVQVVPVVVVHDAPPGVAVTV